MADELAIPIELEKVVNYEQTIIAMVHKLLGGLLIIHKFLPPFRITTRTVAKTNSVLQVKALYFARLIQKNKQTFLRRNPRIKDPPRQIKQSNFALDMARCN